MHVLVADDNERALSILASRLIKRGYVVTTARDGMAARSAIERNPDIRLVILNWMLPRLDGLALSRELKESRANVYTVVVVGRHFCREVRDAFASWADRFVSKSVLLEALSAVLSSAQAADELPEMSPRTLLPAKKTGPLGWRRDLPTDAYLFTDQSLIAQRN